MEFDGRKLQQRREDQCLSQIELALAVGRSVDAIRGYEKGRHQPPSTVVPCLARVLKCRPADLCAEEEELAV